MNGLIRVGCKHIALRWSAIRVQHADYKHVVPPGAGHTEQHTITSLPILKSAGCLVRSRTGEQTKRFDCSILSESNQRNIHQVERYLVKVRVVLLRVGRSLHDA
jgi:hypothetical protein